MRDRLKEAIKDAMRAKDSVRLSTLRLMSAALKDQDIAARGDGLGNDAIIALFAKMVKQREEAAKVYEEAGRTELAEQERAEQTIIREFLPKPISEDELDLAVAQAIAQAGATSLRDMGKVMELMKAAYAGRADFGAVGAKVKAALG